MLFRSQTKAMRAVSGAIRLGLSQYRELAVFAQFGSDLDKSTQDMLAQGQKLTEIMKQEQYKPYSVSDQVLILLAIGSPAMGAVPLKQVKSFLKKLLARIETHCTAAVANIRDRGLLSPADKDAVLKEIEEYQMLYAGQLS